MCNDNDRHLTREELTLIELFRAMDERDRHRVMLAAEAVRVNAEQSKRYQW